MLKQIVQYSRQPLSCLSAIAATLFLVACANSEIRNDADFLPLVGGSPEIVRATPTTTLLNLQLIATNLVSALVQVPETQPSKLTLQVSKPTSAFGNLVVRALEEAGFGVQRVSADQGENYVTYGRRFSETEAGPVTDYNIAIGAVSVRREYVIDSGGISPSSLMLVNGTERIANITLDDMIFSEQGRIGESFISGVESGAVDGPLASVSTVTVNDYDIKPRDKRTEQERVLAEARTRYSTVTADQQEPLEIEKYRRLRYTVLQFENNVSKLMGRGNKRAINLLMREYQAGDVYEIAACRDADGKDPASLGRAVRIEEEFISHGVRQNSLYRAPCFGGTYRHKSDNSPVSVTVNQYRPLVR